jgi:hypothetical protein
VESRVAYSLETVTIGIRRYSAPTRASAAQLATIAFREMACVRQTRSALEKNFRDAPSSARPTRKRETYHPASGFRQVAHESRKHSEDEERRAEYNREYEHANEWPMPIASRSRDKQRANEWSRAV